MGRQHEGMSLGFITESSLLPRRSKPITVDGGSVRFACVSASPARLPTTRPCCLAQMLMLDAAIADAEKKRSAKPRGKKRAREPKGSILDLVSSKSKRASNKAEDARQRKLGEKVEQYERLCRGEGEAGEDAMVDFERKRAEGQVPSRPAAGSTGEVQVLDEFGRQHTVHAGSKQHSKLLQDKAVASFTKLRLKARPAGQPGEDGGPAPWTHGRAEGDRSGLGTGGHVRGTAQAHHVHGGVRSAWEGARASGRPERHAPPAAAARSYAAVPPPVDLGLPPPPTT